MADYNDLLNITDENILYEKVKDFDKRELTNFQTFFQKKGKLTLALNVISKIQKNKHKNSVLSEGIIEQKAEEDEIDIEVIKENPNQVRKIFSEDEVNSKVKSIRARGLITPITVYKNEKGEIILVAGQLRLEAYRILKTEEPVKYSKIKVVFRKKDDIEEYGEEDFRRDSLTENIVRTEMHIIDTALNIKADFESEKKKNNNLSLSAFGDIYGKPKSYVFDYLKIADIVENNKELLEKLKDKNIDSRRLLIAIGEIELSVDDKIKIVEDYNEGKIRIVDIEKLKNKSLKTEPEEKKEKALTLIDQVFSFKQSFKKSNYTKLKGEDKKFVDDKLEKITKLMNEIKNKIE